MKIAFLGYGNMAKSLAAKWQGKHELFFAGRDPARAAAAAETFGAQSGSMPAAVAFAEVIVLATRNEQVFEAIAAGGGAPAFAGKTVVDINNPVSLETFTTTMDGTRSLTDAIKEALPEADVIKAFNTEAASVWRSEDMVYGGRPKVTLYTADSDRAAAIGAELIRDVGSEPLLIGSNIHAYQLEAMAAIMIKRLFGDSPSHTVFQFIERG